MRTQKDLILHAAQQALTRTTGLQLISIHSQPQRTTTMPTLFSKWPQINVNVGSGSKSKP